MSVEGGSELPVRKNMPVKYIQENGNELQKAVIHMFDYDGDGKINKREAKEYNRYNLEKFENGTVTLISLPKSFSSNKKEAFTFVYNNPSDLRDLAIWNHGIYRRSDAKHVTGEAITYDTVNGKYTVSNGKERQQFDIEL